MIKRISEEKRDANVCPKATVSYFHRWEVDRDAGVHTCNAIPELESGEFLPRIYTMQYLKCTACGAKMCYETSDAIDVEEHYTWTKE